MLTAVLICAGLLFAWFAAYSYLTAPRKTAPYQGRHGAPFADPADRDDPDGTEYVAQLRDAGRLPYVTGEADEPDEADSRDVPDVWDTLREPASDDDGETRADLHAVATWGKTPAQLADELAAKYLTAEVPQ